MAFEQDKNSALEGYNEAKRLELVDKDIIKELDSFNKLGNYYTTSSCSGRILLLKVQKSGVKMENAFYYKTHSKADNGKIIKLVDAYKDKHDLWFKLEAFILHIGCRDLNSARELLSLCRCLGIKRAGINAFSKRIMVEIIGTQAIDAPVVFNNKKMVPDAYLKLLVKEANTKMSRNKNCLSKFFKESRCLK